MRSACLLGLLICSGLASAQYPGSVPPPTDAQSGYSSISIQDAKKHLGYLAGPECEGRGTGAPGFQKAADYVAARFKEYGLKPMGDDGTYFQWARSFLYRTKPTAGIIRTQRGSIKVGPDLNPGKIFETTAGSGPIVVIRAKPGHGSLPDGLNLKGTVVLLVGDGVDPALRVDVQFQEPTAMLTVTKTVPKVVWQVMRKKPGAGRISGTISERAAKALVDPALLNLESMTSTLDTQKAGDALVSVEVKGEEVDVPNVVGLLPGSDPTLSKEVVGVGAHLDHLGTDGTVTYWGADDDGSGSTAVLGVAKAFAKNKTKPKRSILFMTFFGEEMGLLGSSHYAEHPIVPMDSMISELQMDMVARDSYGPQNGDPNRVDKLEENINTLRLVGSKRISSDLDAAIQAANKYVGFRFLYDSEDVYTRSDHYNFARNGVPVAFFFDGFTPDYHQPSDTLDKIDWAKLTNTAKLCFLTAHDLANRQTAPVKDVK